MLNSSHISEQFPNGTVVAGIGLFIVGTYYVPVWRSFKQIAEPLAPPDAPYQPEKPSWPELRYLQWGVFVSVVFFMFAGAADTGRDWLLALTGCLMGFCAALFFAIFGVGFVSLFYLWQELVSQFRSARIRSVLLSFPRAISWLVLGLAVTTFFAMVAEKIPAEEKSASRYATILQRSVRMRELDWNTYVDKVQGAWMGKMIGVTFGQPWEFNYLGAPIGFDITDWTLSPTHMRDYRARIANRADYEDPVIREADSLQVHINKGFIESSEKEHPSFGAPDNDDIYINLLFLYCLRRYGIDVSRRSR